jgi:carbon-monoxide dehydrogenase medium subunit
MASSPGGNLCFAEPDSDPGVLLLAQNATVRLERAGADRQMPLDNFFLGAYEVALQQDELLTFIEVPGLAPGEKASYQRFGVLERPLASVAVIASTVDDGSALRDVRIAVGCVGERPVRAREAEVLLEGVLRDDEIRLQQAANLAATSADAIDDHRASAEYRRHLVGVLTMRAVKDVLIGSL